MTWKTIRLELDSTPSHPAGSAGRAYIIRLPLDDDGAVDQSALKDRPRHATVRRFWPSEADRAGQIESHGTALALRCNGAVLDPLIATMEAARLRLGEAVTIVEADGTRLPFRVASIASFGEAW